MSYICQACGVIANDVTSLCHPTEEEFSSKSCGAPVAEVCQGKLGSMKYSCDDCDSVSASPDLLCNPIEVR